MLAGERSKSRRPCISKGPFEEKVVYLKMQKAIVVRVVGVGVGRELKNGTRYTQQHGHKKMENNKYRRGCGKLETFCSASEGVKWCHHCRDSLAVPQRVQHRMTSWPSNSTPMYIPRIKHGCSNKNLDTHGHQGAIYSNL